MTGTKLTKKERERRESANARRLQLQRDRKRRGICGCGKSTSANPRTGKRYACCDTCRAAARRSYREYHPVALKEAKLDLRLKDRTGVRRRLERDGMGREAWWWIATANFGGKQRSRRWAVTAHGDREARRLAIAQREEWTLKR
jgi:hypothetical protein